MGEGDTLRVGVTQPVKALHPGELADMTEVFVLGQIFESPFRRKRNGESEPVLFEGQPRIEARGDGVRHLLRVRPGLRLSDGSPLTAPEVARSLSRADLLRELQIAADGDDVVFTADHPFTDLAERLASRACAIVVEREGRFLGTGPFTELARDDAGMVLLANPHARQPPRVERLLISVHPPDPSGRPTALIEAIGSGEIDLTTELLQSDIAGLSRVRRQVRIGDSTGILFMNVDGWFSDPADRRALASGIDREAITARCYENPMAYTATGLIPPRLDRSRDDISLDREAARAHFARRRPGRPLRTMTLWGSRPYLPDLDGCIQELTAQLRDLGMSLEIIKARNAAEYFELAAAGAYDLALSGWITETASAADFASAILRGTQVRDDAGGYSVSGNLSRLQDAEMDRRLDAYRDDPSVGNRQAIEARLSDTRPLVPLMYGAAVVVHTWRVRGIEWDAADELDLSTAELG